MQKRLETFLNKSGITKAQFADSINVARANISHILAGRNKPGYDFIVNTMTAYPNLNIEWLLTGEGEMYKDGSESPSLPDSDGLFNSQAHIKASNTPQSIVKETFTAPETLPAPKVKRIVVFFDDGSYQEFC